MFPPNPFDTGVDRFLVMVMVLLFWGYVILLLVRYLRRQRPGLAVAGALEFGYLVRVLSIAAVTATGVGSSLRGGDEVGFLNFAHSIASSSFSSSDWLPFGHYGLYEIVFALQLRLGEFTVDTMRITDVGLAMIGTALVVVAVHDLAGARASRLTAWLLAVEPASIFFSEVLHKEPFMLLATGLVVFGGSKIWRRLTWGGIMTMGAGGAVAVATRPYAGWLLISAAVFLTMHAAVRNLDQRGRAIPMLLIVVAVIAVATPVILHETSKQSLHGLQASQTANAQSAGTAGNNLALEQVNYSTRSAIITNLPSRIADLLLRPWPWQVANANQRLGVVGTFVVYATLYVLGLYVVRWRRRALQLAAPLLYPLFFLTIAYSVSVGNAGTGFRYRSQLVGLIIATAVLLRERWLQLPVATQVPPAGSRPRLQSAGMAPSWAGGGPLWHAKMRYSRGLEDRGVEESRGGVCVDGDA
jgi:hypothetical protein